MDEKFEGTLSRIIENLSPEDQHILGWHLMSTHMRGALKGVALFLDHSGVPHEKRVEILARFIKEKLHLDEDGLAPTFIEEIRSEANASWHQVDQWIPETARLVVTALEKALEK